MEGLEAHHMRLERACRSAGGPLDLEVHPVAAKAASTQSSRALRALANNTDQALDDLGTPLFTSALAQGPISQEVEEGLYQGLP